MPMKKHLLLTLFLICSGVFALAQNPSNLIISEIWMGGNAGNSYVEITNIGNDTADLSNYFVAAGTNGGDIGSTNLFWVRLRGTLLPGKSYLIVPYQKADNTSTPEPGDSTNVTPSYYWAAADHILPPLNGLRPGESALRFYGGDDACGLVFDKDDDGIFNLALGDSVLDRVGWLLSKGEPGARYSYPEIAGVTDAPHDHVLIRKASVTRGNAGDFESGRGVSDEDSEWIVIPFNPIRTSHFFPTVKNHGNSFTWSMTSGTVTIGSGTMTVPWGVRRDSLYQQFAFGQNMAWFMRWGPDTLESTVVQAKDTLIVYLCGNTVTRQKYAITVAPPAESMNLVFPKIEGFVSGETGRWVITRYGVSDDFAATIDTIYNVPFGGRIDTLMTYLEIASNATWETDYFDDILRPDVKSGDKLVVTAQNGSKKEYYLDVAEFEGSHNAWLETILIDGDTLFGFTYQVTSYNLLMSYDSKSFPTIEAHPQNSDAHVTIKNPTNIRGDQEDRTALITVTAEDDTTVVVYQIKFDLEERFAEDFIVPPIFSQHMFGNGWHKGFEIVNPSSVPISLSDYLVITAQTQSFAAKIQDKAVNEKVRWGYELDSSKYAIGIYYTEVGSFVVDIDPGETFVHARINSYWATSGVADFLAMNTAPAAWTKYGFVDGFGMSVFQGRNIWLISIDNDSIFNGTKSADDPDDFHMVDMVGAVGIANNHTIEGVAYVQTDNKSFIRKPEIRFGNVENFGSYGTTPGTSEWIVSVLNTDVGAHTFSFYTDYLSTVYSLKYKVSLNSGPDETIEGVPATTTVTQFFGNLIKANEGQTLVVKSSDGSVTRAEGDAIVDGDKLHVTSKDGTNKTIYAITLGILDGNALLTSTVYTITVNGSNGTISGIPALTTVSDVMSNITVPESAFISLIDQDGNMVAEVATARDTLVEVETVAHDSLYLEVIAEDGTTITYRMSINVPAAPYVTSSIYLVYQDELIIDFFQPFSNVEVFMNNLVPSPGAGMKMYDNYGNLREFGIMYKDDYLVVTDQSQVSTIYTLNQLGDPLQAKAMDPTLKDLTVNGVTVTGFNKNTLLYNIGLPTTTVTIPVIAAVTTDPNATVEIWQAQNLRGDEEERTATVVARSERGVDILLYKVTFTLVLSTDATLKNLTVDGTTVSGFIKSKYSYKVGLPGGTTTVPVVVGVASYDSAEVMVTQATNIEGDSIARTAVVAVTAEDGTTKSTYTVTFVLGYVPSDNATLSDLKVDAVTVSGFEPGTLTYLVILPEGTTTVPILGAVAADDSATLVVTQAQNLTGSLAERTAVVVVTAEDGTQLTYQVTFEVAVGINNLDAGRIGIYTRNSILIVETSSFIQGDMIDVYNITGSLIHKRLITSTIEEINLNGGQGIYIVKVKNRSNVKVTRIVISE